MATWNLNSSIELPCWWTQTLEYECSIAARDALPNEVCGIVSAKRADPVIASGDVQLASATAREHHVDDLRLHVFGGEATPTKVVADPQEVIDFAYWLLSEERVAWATFHTHPLGQRRFSRIDQQFFMWAQRHVLGVLEPVHQQWNFTFIG